MSLLRSLIVASEKAANIARQCRHDQHLFDLLVREKGADEANPRFVRDFKTLADVLIQETVRHDVGREFPVLCDDIRGEEDSTFCNALGETVVVEVLESREATAGLLERVLDGDVEAARSLAKEVHEVVSLDDVDTDRDVPDVNGDGDGSYGIWIDPIDSTSEYITGKEIVDETGVHIAGLRCVTVLIGVYDKRTGHPVMGVINQPFYENRDGRWRGRCYWGTTAPPRSSLAASARTGVVCLSASESDALKKKLSGYRTMEAAGAGYKMLTVANGQADAYVLSKDSTYKWDTCGPHAVLVALGGGLLKFEGARDGETTSVDYVDDPLKSNKSNKIDRCCNRGGIIAYKSAEVLNDILSVLEG